MTSRSNLYREGKHSNWKLLLAVFDSVLVDGNIILE